MHTGQEPSHTGSALTDVSNSVAFAMVTRTQQSHSDQELKNLSILYKG